MADGIAVGSPGALTFAHVEKLVDEVVTVSEEDIARVRGPIGLDIGAESPQEVAVSILAEMTLVRYGHGTGLALNGIEGRVHKQRPEDE